MAKQRYISTGFWTDRWVRTLTPNERYLYMYLLTNPETSIAGIYKILMDRIEFDTGLDMETLQRAFESFQGASKAYYFDEEWVVIPTWPKHQRVTEKNNIRIGIDRVLMELPEPVWVFIHQIDYQYSFMKGLQRPYKALSRDSNYSDLNSDLNLDLNLEEYAKEKPKTVVAEPPTPKPVGEKEFHLKDELADAWRLIFVEKMPSEAAWSNHGQENKACYTLAKLLTALSEKTGEDKSALGDKLIGAFWEKKKNGSGEYWKSAPFTPSQFLTRWSQLVDTLAQGESHEEMLKRVTGDG